MFDSATLTISGNVVANPSVTGVASNPDRVAFRVIANRRKRNLETGEWEQIGEYGMNVVCWRKLARGVASSIRRGDPVLVIGRVVERHFDGRDGEKHRFTEVVADFVGHDLSYGISGPFSRFTRLDRSLEDGANDAADLAAAVDEVEEGMGDFAPADGTSGGADTGRETVPEQGTEVLAGAGAPF